ncbi:hypothetical protein IV203_028683 [Nitzschia inconspicua]|uniref:Transmembrane protein n=1 Tax=Nitzschia inconspicua TaxID=303405 RepID=A0A9K3PZZ6_9STRA|nr:hypothetical protein IV203_028683 [Nitzschia inconspicua]
MACFESLLARRVLLWYILLVSFVIFPFTLTLTLGCKFLIVGIDESNREEHQAFGVFNAAVYDLESPGKNFLGCVDYSQFWHEQTNDIAFRGAKFAGGFLLAFTTLATIINLCLQCFSKHGKSWLWGAMRLSYLVSLLSQGAMYSAFASDICTEVDGQDSQCWLGKNGVAGVFNFFFLFGMVVATFHSFPPRNPVFQCWTGDLDSGSSVDICSDDEDVESAVDVASRHDGSVSLFAPSKATSRPSVMSKAGSRISATSKKSKNSSVSIVGSQKSSKSKRSFSSKKSKVSSKSRDLKIDQTIKENTTKEEDKMSVAEEGDAPVVAEKSENKAKDSQLPTGSFRASIAKRLWGGSKSKNMEESPPDIDEGSFKPVAERVSKLETGLQHDREARAQTVQPPTTSAVVTRAVQERARAGGAEETDSSVIKSKEYPTDLEDSESIQFLKDLSAVTKLGKGGIRVKTTEKGHTVEIVDEYPAKAGEGLNAPYNNDGTDVVKVRTEYYEQGSRTTKEVTHHDGSRTIVTTINSMPSNKIQDDDSISTNLATEKKTKS